MVLDSVDRCAICAICTNANKIKSVVICTKSNQIKEGGDLVLGAEVLDRVESPLLWERDHPAGERDDLRGGGG